MDIHNYIVEYYYVHVLSPLVQEGGDVLLHLSGRLGGARGRLSDQRAQRDRQGLPAPGRQRGRGSGLDFSSKPWQNQAKTMKNNMSLAVFELFLSEFKGLFEHF